MAIYTRTGDGGETDLLGGVRVRKDAELMEVCGDLDELNAALGQVRCEVLPDGMNDLLEGLQRRLFDVGAVLVYGGSGRAAPAAIGPNDVAALEQLIDRYEASLEPVGAFVLPAGSRGAAALHFARTVCRRAERRLVALDKSDPRAVSAGTLPYVNRLSDLLYVLARAANA